MVEVRVEHSLSRERALERLRSAALEVGLELRPDDDFRGVAEGSTPLGAVEAVYVIEVAVVVVTVRKKPAFLPASMVESQIAGGLARALAE